MYIYFIYKNNTFNFNFKNDVSILYLKNLVSKMIQKDKSCFDLFYNNKILSENNITIFQLAKNEKNIPIIISLKKNNNINKSSVANKKVELPILTLSNQINTIKTESDIKNNINLNETDYFNNFSLKDIKMKNKHGIINKVFQNVYNKKEEEIIILMKELKNKILEYDNILFKNYKKGLDEDNNKLLLYEKNIINYKDKQIKFFKTLINYFNTKETSFFSLGQINLEEFYLELSNYNNQSFTNKNTIIKEKNLKKNNLKLTTFKENRLPKIEITRNIEDNLYNIDKISEDSIYSDEIIKEKIDKYLSNKKPKNIIINSNKSPRNNTEQNERTINIFKNEISLEEIKKNSKVNKLILNNTISKNKENNKKSKTIENKNNINLSSSKSISLNKDNKDLTESFDKNKINVLFDTQKKEETESEDDSNNDDGNNNRQKNLEKLEYNLRERKKTLNYIHFKKTKIGYDLKINDRKKTHRLKKLGNNISDFII